MKIVLTASVEEPVPPRKYGGTEMIIYLLSKEYVKLGHDVYLLASGNSQTPAKLVPIVPKSIRQLSSKKSSVEWRDYWKFVSVAREIQEIDKIKPDIIHNHFAWRFLAFENLVKYPMMSTMHGPMTSVREVQTYKDHARHPYISISDNQRKAMPDLNWIGTVYNGIEIDTFPINTSTKNRDYFLFLGRTSPEKGLSEIVQMIRKTKYKLKIAAKLDEVDREYFTTKVEPFIDGKQIKFLGEVGHDEKTKLLMKAKALLLWLNWEEPFGLVVPEANACGTPIIVNRRGSMPELIEDGVNGYMVDSLNDMKQRLSDVDSLDPVACRKRVEERYTSQVMATNYLKLAEKVVEQFA